MAILAMQVLVGTIGKIYDKRTVGAEKRSVIDFSVAVTRSKKVGDEWKDGETYWVTVTAWGQLADNIEATWNVGDRVFVYGRTDMKDKYTNKEGVEVPARPIVVAEFAGHDNSRYPSTQERPERGSNSGGRNNHQSQGRPASKPAPKPAPKDADMDFDVPGDFDLDEMEPPF